MTQRRCWFKKGLNRLLFMWKAIWWKSGEKIFTVRRNSFSMNLTVASILYLYFGWCEPFSFPVQTQIESMKTFHFEWNIQKGHKWVVCFISNLYVFFLQHCNPVQWAIIIYVRGFQLKILYYWKIIGLISGISLINMCVEHSKILRIIKIGAQWRAHELHQMFLAFVYKLPRAITTTIATNKSIYEPKCVNNRNHSLLTALAIAEVLNNRFNPLFTHLCKLQLILYSQNFCVCGAITILV